MARTGVFTENWQAIGASPGDWNLSTRRVLQYVTSQGKVWMIDVTREATDLPQSLRELLIGTYFRIRNGTSYIMFGNQLSWYREYELDLGGYQSEPPLDLETLRVAGAGGGSGGMYLRTYVRGIVLVNSSNQALSYSLSAPMKRAAWSGGGVIDSNANPPSYTLTYDQDVPAGSLSVPAQSVVLLRDPAGPPPPSVEGPVSVSPGSACGSTQGLSFASALIALVALLSRAKQGALRRIFRKLSHNAWHTGKKFQCSVGRPGPSSRR